MVMTVPFWTLEVRRFDSILRNILEEGLFSVQKQIFEPEAAQRVK